ncbi:AraC family transcriptional regulator [Micromonospora sp. KC207]|uniref:AraC family transcriptional regulator n=1 Tax=Micromonospora sp. KC207 TaxID=2530377 RepID=UPI001047F9B0|nr:AraC family transcriptional regulator [Micromonospora sp. KC207]TDC67066.1 AraC family transcriptional regulator [Micromonospora sp. KC207]
MLSFVDLAARPEFAVTAVTCRNDHTNWSAVESHRHVQVVLVRQGRFRRRARGVSTDIDPTVGYLGMPGEEEDFAHPAGGDLCTSISLTPTLWWRLAGDAPRLTTSAVYVDARLDLAHRRLLATTRTPDIDYAGAERLTGLIRHIVEQVIAAPALAGASARPGDRALVAAVRDLIRDTHPAATGLLPLATYLDVSPYRLSRAFTRELGVSLTRYRNRLRVTRALDRLEAGETRLAALAADLGFADQAHLTRTMRDHLGHTPTVLRRLLARQVVR